MENWMSKLPDDKKIIFINIPGSHDSAAFNINFFGSVFAKTQDLDISQQLRIGVRKFDIRVVCNKSNFLCFGLNQIEQDKFLDMICCHGICNCYCTDENNNEKELTYKSVLLTFKNFLEENPTETIILSTSSGRGNKFQNMNRASQIFENLVGEKAIQYNKNLNLGKVRGKIVNTNYKTKKVDLEGNPIYNNGIEDGYGLDEIHKSFVPDFNYATFKVDGNLKVEELRQLWELNDITINQAEKELKNNKFPFNYSISCTGEFDNIIPLPKTQADIVNNFLLNYDLKKGNYYGWINIDFIDMNITKKIIDTNFI